MIPLVDRPFILHVVECLIDKGVTEFDFILGHLPEKIERLLGDGSRWSRRFRYHLVRQFASPYTTVRSICLGAEEYAELFLAHADRLPQAALDTQYLDMQSPVVFCSENNRDIEWTGWAWLPARNLMKIIDSMDESSLGAELIETARTSGSVIKISNMLSVRSYEHVLSSQETFLEKRFPKLTLPVREAEGRIWISRNVTLHPTVRLIPPVFIGENCRIGGGAHLGPNAVIGSDCLLDARCIVSDALILPGSYVGEALELANVIVDRNRLINTSVGVAITVADDFLLGSLSENHLRQSLGNLFSRLAASLLLIMVWPILLVTAIALWALRGKPALHKKECVRLPADSQQDLWQTFRLWSFSSDETSRNEGREINDLFFRFLPSLINIARGEMRFVGVRPRSRSEVDSLPADWQALYLKAKAGAITEAFVLYGSNPSEDELYSTEAFYSVSSGLRHDLKLVIGYFARVIAGRRYER